MGKGSLAVAALGATFSAVGLAYFQHLKNEADKTIRLNKLDVKAHFDWSQYLINVDVGAPYGIVSDGFQVVRPGGVLTFNATGQSSFHPNQSENLSPITRFLYVCTKVTRLFKKECECIRILEESAKRWEREEREKCDYGHVSQLKNKPKEPVEDHAQYMVEAMAVAHAYGMYMPPLYEFGPQYSSIGVSGNGGMGIRYDRGTPRDIVTPWGALASRVNPESADEALKKELVKEQSDQSHSFLTVTKGLFGREMKEIVLDREYRSLEWQEMRNSVLSKLNEKLKEKFKGPDKAKFRGPDKV